MSLLSLALRLSPLRSTVYFESGTVLGVEVPADGESPPDPVKDAKDTIPAGVDTVAVEPSSEDLRTEEGYSILQLSSCSIPDPRIRASGHLCAVLYVYTCFLLALAYAVVRYTTHETMTSVSVLPTSTLAIQSTVEISVQCPSVTTTALLVANYTSSLTCGGTFQQFTRTVAAGSDSTVFPAVALCSTALDKITLSASPPSTSGLLVYFSSIPFATTCTLSVQSNASGLMASVSIEGGLTKTMWLGVSQSTGITNEVSVSMSLSYYELDGVRSNNAVAWGTPGADTSSVVMIRMDEVATVVVESDDQTTLKFFSYFGQVWGLVGKITFVLIPLLAWLFPREIISDVKCGKIDDYTRRLVADAWKPVTVASFQTDIMNRMKTVLG